MELKKPSHKGTKRRRRGRGDGSGLGTYSGRGLKGQKQHGKAKSAPFEGGRTPLHQQLPKMGGFVSLGRKPVTLTLDLLSKVPADTSVTPAYLIKEGLVDKSLASHSMKVVKTGELKHKLDFQDIGFTRSAKVVVEQLGGKIEFTEDYKPVRKRTSKSVRLTHRAKTQK